MADAQEIKAFATAWQDRVERIFQDTQSVIKVVDA
jgi:hypothetical protein